MMAATRRVTKRCRRRRRRPQLQRQQLPPVARCPAQGHVLPCHPRWATPPTPGYARILTLTRRTIVAGWCAPASACLAVNAPRS